jgi:hypothetical protein
MSFGMAVGFQCRPFARSPADHFAVGNEALDSRHAARDAQQPIGAKQRLNLRRILQPVGAKEFARCCERRLAPAAQHHAREFMGALGHQHRHSMAFLQPGRQPDVVRMDVSDEHGA